MNRLGQVTDIFQTQGNKMLFKRKRRLCQNFLDNILSPWLYVLVDLTTSVQNVIMGLLSVVLHVYVIMRVTYRWNCPIWYSSREHYSITGNTCFRTMEAATFRYSLKHFTLCHCGFAKPVIFSSWQKINAVFLAKLIIIMNLIKICVLKLYILCLDVKLLFKLIRWPI